MIIPYDDNIVIHTINKNNGENSYEQQDGFIISCHKEDEFIGEVVAVGNNVGDILHTGDKVYYSKYNQGTPIPSQDLLIVKASDIIAIIKED